MRPQGDSDEPKRSEPGELDAAVRLLGDDSPSVVSAASELLRSYGLPARRALHAVRDTDCVPTRVRARALLRSFEVRDLLRREAAVLRETSTVFAALIGWFILGEKVGPRRLILMSMVALGAVIVEMGS